jgi:hypothetical protein
MNGEETLVMVTCILCLIACMGLALMVMKED